MNAYTLLTRMNKQTKEGLNLTQRIGAEKWIHPTAVCLAKRLFREKLKREKNL